MPKTTTLTLRMTEPERAALLRLVEGLNAEGRRLHHRRITPSSLLRGCVRSLLDTDLLETDPAPITALNDTNTQLRRIGTNLNQLSRAYHQGLLTAPVDVANLLAALQSAVEATRASLRAVLQAAGGKGLRLRGDALRHLD